MLKWQYAKLYLNGSGETVINTQGIPHRMAEGRKIIGMVDTEALNLLGEQGYEVYHVHETVNGNQNPIMVIRLKRAIPS